MKKIIAVTLLPLLFALPKCSFFNKNSEDKKSDDTAITEVNAFSYNEGVTLYWNEVKDATKYVVYQNDSKIRETDVNYTVVHNLTNNVEYKFDVEVMKGTTVSQKINVKATPIADGEEKDPLIDLLNTPLENQIGSTKIKLMRGAGNLNNVSQNPNANPNLFRFKRVLEAMKSGTSQTIGYIGGSITVGETAKALDKNNHQKGYAYYTYNWLKENYDTNRNSKFINASISGTDTCIASVRIEKDLLQYNPDLVFFEFCANNSTSIFDQKTYESLIRRILRQPNSPAVVLLFSATNYSQYNQDSYMLPMGNYYRLPMFSMVNAMISVCGSSSNLTLNDPIFGKFSDDATHPNDEGHKLYAKLIAATLRGLYNQQSSDTSYEVPSSPWHAGYDCYENLTYVNNVTNNEIISSLGSFTASDTSERVLKDTADVEAFRKGWKKTNQNENNAMQITVNCKSFFIIYLAGNDYVANDPKGKMVATFQNKDAASDNGSLTWESNRTQKQGNITTVNDNGNGWDNPCCMILLDNNTSATYDISISMENNQGIGTILAFGYCN